MVGKEIVLLFCFAILVDAQVLKHHFVLRNVADSNTNVDDDWWKTAIFYQIYPRSFMDSNGDGIGDLQGIISKLDHLKDMGVSAAWLSPVYKSPGVDQGYDISDYRDIDPIFGDLTDLQSLVSKAHEMGIKIIMDFVPNHTSDQHYWFQQSIKKNGSYSDYYIWSGTDENQPPNNWISVFGGSAWQWNDERQQFYLHQFATAQPDLNYNNLEVVEEMKNVLKFWLDFGIDGFRMDAVNYLFEDPKLTDEPLSGAAGVDATQYGYLKHIYTTNLDNTYNMIYEFRQFLDEYNKNVSYTRVMMTEAYTDTAEQAARYYGNSTTNGAHFTFNFNYITYLTANLTADKIITTTSRWLSHLDKKYVNNWVLGNHDRNRVATRFGVENIDGLNMLTAFLPGIQVTYMGEEIGMENGYVSCEQGYDPQAIKNCTTFNETSRDFIRTPFQWDDTANAGFSTNSSTWLPVSNKYTTINLKAQNVQGFKTHYNVYKDMVKFRKNFKTNFYDALSLIKISDNVLQIIRKASNGEYVYLFNTGDSSEKIYIYSDDVDYEIAVTSIGSLHLVGDILSNPVTLQAHESVVSKVTTRSGAATNSLISIWMLSFIVFLCYFTNLSNL